MGMEKRNGLSLAKNLKVEGEGDKTVILAHGYGADQSFWEKVIPELAGSHQVIVFDWDFQGPVGDHLSSLEAFTDDLISLVDSLELGDGPSHVVYVGHSMSGMIGCLASIRRPNLFKKLIIVAASPMYLNEEGYEGGLERGVVADMLSFLEADYRAWVASFASMAIGNKYPSAVEKYENCLVKNMKQDVALSLAKTLFYGDLRDVLAEVEVPCTIVQTTGDPVVPMFVAKYMQKAMKNGCVEVIEADTHCPQLVAHESFLKVLDKAINL